MCSLLTAIAQGGPPTLCQQYVNAPAALTFGVDQNSITFLSTNFPAPAGTTFSGTKIIINGVLKLDRHLTLNNCTIELGQGAQIINDGAHYLLAVSSRFYACTQLWQGIYLKTGGSAGLYFCQIEDAEAALTMDDGTFSGVYGTTFNRNHIGIRNGTATSGVASINFLTFGDNRFQCTSNILPPFTPNLAPAHTGTVSYCGIYLNTAVAAITSVPQSRFTGSIFGLYADKADVTISGATFTNMVNSTDPNCRSGIVVVNGSLTALQDSFSLLRYGVRALGSELDVHDNTFFVDMHTAISGLTSTDNLNTDFLLVRNNQIQMQPLFGGFFMQKWGISVNRNSRSGPQTSLDISGNNITIFGNAPNAAGAQQRGIYVWGQFPSLDVAQIGAVANTVTITGAARYRQNGIEVMGGTADNFYINNNTVSYIAPQPAANPFRWGISMTYSTGTGHAMRNNTVTSTGVDSTVFCSIHLEDVANLLLCNNLTNVSDHGLHFFGGFPGIRIFDNTVTNHLWGIRLQDNLNNGNPGNIGIQTRTANRWAGAYGLTGAGYVAPVMIATGFIVPAGSIPPVAPPANQFTDPFITFLGVGETHCPPPPPFTGEIDDYDRKVADGSGLQGGPMDWEAKRALMYKLYRFPNLVNSESTISNFYSANQNANTGRFAQTDYQLLAALQVADADNSATNTLINQRTTTIAQLRSWDQTNGSYGGTPSAPSSTLATDRQALLDALKSNRASRAAAKQTRQDQRQAAVTLVKQSNQNLATSSAQEMNWKTINAIRFDQALGIAPGTAALDQLRAIAAQCPTAVGSSVVAAINMLPAEEQAQWLPAEGTGLTGACGRTQATGAVSAGILKLSPNPATDLISVELSAGTSGSWEVIDLEGRVLLTGKVQDQRQFWLRTDALANGVYLLRIRSAAALPMAQKFIISK